MGSCQIKNKSKVKKQIKEQLVSPCILYGDKNQFIRYKITNYDRFLQLKLDFRLIMHKKIVHKMYQQYLPQQQLDYEYRNYYGHDTQFCTLEDLFKPMNSIQHLQWNNSYDIFDNQYGKATKFPRILYLKCFIKNFQRIFYLKCLTLNLQKQQMNNNILIFKQEFGKGLQFLYNLKYLHLNLSENRLGESEQNFKLLKDSLKINMFLEHLQLNVSNNLIGKNENNLIYIKEILLRFKKLKFIELNLQKNNLEDIKYLVEGVQQLQNLEYFELNLQENQLGDNQQNLSQLSEGLQKLSKLQWLILQLGGNNLGNNINNFKYLGQCLKLQFQLKELTLGLQMNKLKQNEKNLMYLMEGLDQKNTIQYLNLNFSGNYLGKQFKYYKYLGNIMQHMGNLYHLKLDLNNNQLSKFKKNFWEYFKGIFQNQEKLKNFELVLDLEDLGQERNIQQFGYQLQNIPNLQKLRLELIWAQYKEDEQKIQDLLDSLKKLSHLKELQLKFWDKYYYLQNMDMLKYLVQGLESLPNLKILDTQLDSNYPRELGFNQKQLNQILQGYGPILNLENLGYYFGQISNLRYIEFNFSVKQKQPQIQMILQCLEDKSEQINQGTNIQKLSRNFQQLKVNIYDLSGCSYPKKLGKCLEQIPNLECLKVNFQNIVVCVSNLQDLVNSLKEVVSLQQLYVDLRNTELNNYQINNFQKLIEKDLSQLEKFEILKTTDYQI